MTTADMAVLFPREFAELATSYADEHIIPDANERGSFYRCALEAMQGDARHLCHYFPAFIPFAAQQLIQVI